MQRETQSSTSRDGKRGRTLANVTVLKCKGKKKEEKKRQTHRCSS